MLGILADSLMVAARTDRVWMRDARVDEEKKRRDRYFWQGRRWRAIDPRDL